MRKSLTLTAAAAVGSVVGCATAPPAERGYAAVRNEVISASASDQPAAPMSLPTEPDLSGPHDEAFYIRLALERSPAVLAARRDVAAVVQTVPQVTALADPMLTERFWPSASNSPQTASGRFASSVMLSQNVPWPNKLRVRGEVAEQEAAMALSRLAGEELATVERVRLAYYDIYFYQRALAVTRENTALLDELIGYAEARLRTGGSQQDVLRIGVERDKLDNRLIDYGQRLEQSQADLAALLHAGPETRPLAAGAIDLPPVPQTLDHLYEVAARCRPELRERLHKIIRDQRQEQLARLASVPDMSFGIAYDVVNTDQSISRVATGNDNVGLQVGLNLPIYRDRLQAGVREAEHRVVESARRYDAERDDTIRQIRRLAAAADAAERQLALYRDRIVPRTRQALEVSIADYRTGRGDVLQVVDNYSELLAFEIQVARFEADLGQAMASLERVVGCEVLPFAQPTPLPDSAAPPAPAEDTPPADPEARVRLAPPSEAA